MTTLPESQVEKWKPGRPARGSDRVSLGLSLEGLAMRLAMQRQKQNRLQFQELMGVQKSTVSKWLSGQSRAPAWPEIRKRLQVACPGGPPRPFDKPSAWVRLPETRNKKKLQSDNNDLPILAAMSVQHQLGRATVAAGHDPIIHLDRVAATASVHDKGAFLNMLKATLNPVYLGEDALYRWSAKTDQDLFIQASPRFNTSRIDLATGELLEPSFIRVDIPGRLLQNPPLASALVKATLQPYILPESWQVTLIDIATTYDEPHLALLSYDRRARITTVLRPDHEALRDLAVNVYFGSKNSERYIRTYNKLTEVTDKALSDKKSGADLWSRILAEEHAHFAHYPDHALPESIEPWGDELVTAVRYDDQAARRWPSSIRGWTHAHRIEGSVRPRSPAFSGAIDRHPAGLVHRIVEHASPFEHHQVVHLGLVDPESPLAPILVWARAEGIQTILDDIKAVATTPKEQAAYQRLLVDELDHLAEATEHLLFHPDVLLSLGQAELQETLDAIFGLAAAQKTEPT